MLSGSRLRRRSAALLHMQQTNYVFGLFEGGGAKGVAYAGVVQACKAGGIRFEGACGVSAGSIAATFVCAGIAEPKLVELLMVPLTSILKTGMGRIHQRALGTLGHWLVLSGYRSSQGIENWVDMVLRQALGLNRTVLFDDLERPLAILAYDAANRQPHIWSKKRTPYESVGWAVRASCALPFYFGAVKGNGGNFLDGGLIENVPTFLIKELTENTELPTLAFRLVGGLDPLS